MPRRPLPADIMKALDTIRLPLDLRPGTIEHEMMHRYLAYASKYLTESDGTGFATSSLSVVSGMISDALDWYDAKIASLSDALAEGAIKEEPPADIPNGANGVILSKASPGRALLDTRFDIGDFGRELCRLNEETQRMHKEIILLKAEAHINRKTIGGLVEKTERLEDFSDSWRSTLSYVSDKFQRRD